MKIAIAVQTEDTFDQIASLLMQWSQSYQESITYDRLQDNFHCDIVIYEPSPALSNAQLRERIHSFFTTHGFCFFILLTPVRQQVDFSSSLHVFGVLSLPLEYDRLSAILSDASSYINAGISSTSHLTISSKRNTLHFDYNDICYIESDANYCIIHTNQEVRCRITFQQITAELLSDSRFFVVNRGLLVNWDYVVNIENSMCIMKNGKMLPLNTKRQKIILQIYMDYQKEKHQQVLS